MFIGLILRTPQCRYRDRIMNQEGSVHPPCIAVSPLSRLFHAYCPVFGFLMLTAKWPSAWVSERLPLLRWQGLIQQASSWIQMQPPDPNCLPLSVLSVCSLNSAVAEFLAAFRGTGAQFAGRSAMDPALIQSGCPLWFPVGPCSLPTARLGAWDQSHSPTWKILGGQRRILAGGYRGGTLLSPSSVQYWPQHCLVDTGSLKLDKDRMQ